jgi:hypothetical protein
MDKEVKALEDNTNSTLENEPLLARILPKDIIAQIPNLLQIFIIEESKQKQIRQDIDKIKNDYQQALSIRDNELTLINIEVEKKRIEYDFKRFEKQHEMNMRSIENESKQKDREDKQQLRTYIFKFSICAILLSCYICLNITNKDTQAISAIFGAAVLTSLGIDWSRVVNVQQKNPSS